MPLLVIKGETRNSEKCTLTFWNTATKLQFEDGRIFIVRGPISEVICTHSSSTQTLPESIQFPSTPNLQSITFNLPEGTFASIQTKVFNCSDDEQDIFSML